MLMPDKHISFSESLLGLGGYIVSQIKSPKSVDALWKAYQADCAISVYPFRHSFDNLMLAILFLYTIGAISEENGMLRIAKQVGVSPSATPEPENPL